jgi:predicted Ser/Thr protein kinase
MIGPYRVLGLLGKGGMGLVYLAEEEHPRRQVALKMLRPGAATDEHLRRFAVEAEALGRLDHPGIARIYQAGTADTGHGPQPYFAMEFVKGRPLTAHAEHLHLGIHERLRLMVQICRAVDYAHRKGIVHRDLKPGNIMVDEEGHPKVLDFGVARVADGDLLGATLQTQEGQLIGTPAYMSPEQAAADPTQLDSLTDVYTLGVICFELIAGRLPQDLRGKAVLAAVRMIQEEEPTRLGSVNKAFRGDLETIVAKALEKDKARRYTSAEAFALDLECYLDQKPIKARPAGTAYQLFKFAQRNKVLAGSLVLTALFLVVATGVSLWWALAAKRAEKQARLAEQQARDYLAETYEQAARLAIQRGAWRDALTLTDKALATDRYRDSVPLRLNKVRALVALNDLRGHQEELKALAMLPDLGEHEGYVLLLEGDYQLSRDEAKGVELLRRARDKGLPPGADAYVQALLAKTTPQAVELLKKSLALDPYQPRARSILELLLILLARFPEAGTELAAHEALFPEDLNAKVLHAMLAALERKLDEAERVLEELRGPLGDEPLPALRALVKLFSEFQNPANRIDPVTGLPDLTHHFTKVAFALPGFWYFKPAIKKDEIPAAFKGYLQTFPLHPLLRQSFVRTLVAWGGDVLSPKGIDELTKACAVHPEGTLLYIRAIVLFGALRFAEAEKAALLAAETPALLPIRRQALFTAATVEGAFYALFARTPGRRQKIIDILRDMLAMEPPVVLYRPEVSVSLALAVGEVDLARQILDQWESSGKPTKALGVLFAQTQPVALATWSTYYLSVPLQRQFPEDTGALYGRAQTEMVAGAFVRAVEAADRILQQEARNEAMVKLQKQASDIKRIAIRKLREQVQRLDQSSSSRRAP